MPVCAKTSRFPVPTGLDYVHVAPLWCAGIIGFRSLVLQGIARPYLQESHRIYRCR